MRIILADQHASALWALRTMLHEQPEFDIVGEAVNAQSLLSLALEQTADMVLVDWDLPGAAIEDLIADLHAFVPRPTVIAMASEPEYGRLLLRAGADAFVSKGDQPEWLLATLHRRYVQRNKYKG